MELVVLVDGKNNVIGVARKDDVHTNSTPLHRGFSLFLFNGKNELLLTKRVSTKKTFPGAWTNTVCGHPGPGESTVDAATRRLKEELGIEETQVAEVAPYRYRFTDTNGIVENEICPILVVYSTADPKPNPQEVDDWKWMPWKDFVRDTKQHAQRYSPWSVEETAVLNARMKSLRKAPAVR